MTTRLRCGSRWQLGARLTSGPDGMSPRWSAMLACKQRRHPFASPATQVPALPFCRGGIDRDDHRCSIGFAPKPALPGSLPASLGATRADRGLARSIDDIAKRSRRASLTPCRIIDRSTRVPCPACAIWIMRRVARQRPGQEGPPAQPHAQPASCQPSPHASPSATSVPAQVRRGEVCFLWGWRPPLVYRGSRHGIGRPPHLERA